MATKDEKISALSKLMTDGIITSEEFAKLVTALESNAQTLQKEKSPAQLAYEQYIENVVSKAFKSPASIKYPPFSPEMVKHGTIKLDAKEQTLKYIETYVDAANSYGALLREPIIIVIDDNFNCKSWAQHLSLGSLFGKSKAWITMSKK